MVRERTGGVGAHHPSHPRDDKIRDGQDGEKRERGGLQRALAPRDHVVREGGSKM